MLKQLIIGLAIITVVAMLWPAASAQAQCTGWVQGKDPASPTKWCYWCPTGWTNVSGAWVQTGYCLAWWGSSAFNGVEFKAPPSANTCAKDGDYSDCPTVISAVYGRVNLDGNCPDPNVLDADCGINALQICCPPGHAKNAVCEPPGDTPGWPGIYEGFEFSSQEITDCTTRNCKTNVQVPFGIACPNQNWGAHVIPYNFNGLTCVCPLGFEKDQGRLKCCVERNKDGKCENFGSASATALWCKDMNVPDTYVIGQTVIFGPTPSGQESCTSWPGGPPEGTCCDLGTTALPGGNTICEDLSNL